VRLREAFFTCEAPPFRPSIASTLAPARRIHRIRLGEAAVGEVHRDAPAEDHAEGEDEEEAGGLLQGDEAVEVAAGEEADEREHDHDDEKGGRAVHHDGLADQLEARGADEGFGEEERAGEEGGEAQIQGIRNGGARNMQKPVAMPRGGMTILRAVTALRLSPMRQAMMTRKPRTALVREAPGRKLMGRCYASGWGRTIMRVRGRPAGTIGPAQSPSLSHSYRTNS